MQEHASHNHIDSLAQDLYDVYVPAHAYKCCLDARAIITSQYVAAGVYNVLTP